MTTVDVGLVGLDTSHGEAFGDALSALDDARVTAVWDGGEVREEGYVESFCEEYGASAVETPGEMRDAIDAAMVLAVDWERHRPLAVPFLESGIPTAVDKPIAGRVADLDAIGTAAGDTPLFGGSSIPFHPGFADLPIGTPERHCYCVGYGDPFYYGVHLADTARRLAGADWRAVEPSAEPGHSVVVAFENDAHATLRLDGPREGVFGIVDAADQVRTATAGNDADAYAAMYRRFAAAFLDVARGERDEGGCVLDGATLLLAIHAATETGERVVPESEALDAVDVGSDAFVADYQPYY